MTKMKNSLVIDWEIEEEKGLCPFIERAFEATLKTEGINFPCELEALIVSESTIQEMNRDYREIDKVTDVLSFPLYDNLNDAANEAEKLGSACLGNMVICLQRAKEQALEYGHSLEREICFLTVHSVLHLLGYDHELGQAEESLMFQKQKDILDGMGVVR